MSQQSLGDSYERMASLKASNGLVCSMINAGLIKPENIEDAFMVEETYYNRYLVRLVEGLDTESAVKQGFTESKSPTQKDSSSEVIIELHDGKIKTQDCKDDIKSVGFWWNNPPKSFTWKKTMTMEKWHELEQMYPFDSLEYKILNKGGEICLKNQKN